MSKTNDVNRSEAGDPIYRHQPRQGGLELPTEYHKNAKSIEGHIQQYFGTSSFVWHEIVSDIVHIDVHVIPPTNTHHFYTLITSGMSDLPMNTVEKRFQFAELVMCLPTSWPIMQLRDQKVRETSLLKDLGRRFLPSLYPDSEMWYWPVRCLKTLARLPHEYKTHIGIGHTIPNGGEKAKPYASNTKLCCAFIAPPTPIIPDDFVRLDADNGEIWFLSVVPIYKAEMDFKLKQGAGALLKRLEAAKVSELLDINRQNVCP